ncbi:helix-turn-helix transcriptional regulator [Paenibacillus eucommiae]|uniref:AraC-like DNA-binding protein n=1 Tax=Paenibacillus eucommiae TaxID=1355755 RepID=A0ABS4IU33_9BACL|nr:AraC family transcriptional regulator [Paenibacillus eucommiae]MBP1991018.1 AraC-like DNA-binding protein [Paenibacillus eucommiae]
MNHSLSLSNILNSLEVVFISSGVTKINAIKDAQWLSNTFNQPFSLITQIVGGRILVETESASFEIGPGQAWFIAGHVNYRIKLLDDEFVTNWLNLDVRLFEHFQLFDLVESPYWLSVSHGNEIGRLQAEIHALMQHDSAEASMSLLAAMKVKQQLFKILETVLSVSRLKITSLDDIRNYQRFQPMFAYIENRLAEKIKVSQLAEILSLSTSHFHKEFKELFHESPLQYIRAQRMKKAQYMLASTDLNIGEIANSLGFESAYPFIRFFKSMNGTSPGQYRKTVLDSFFPSSAARVHPDTRQE